jgi:hypothetical protein
LKDALAGVTELQVMEAGIQRDPDRSLTNAYPGLLRNHLLGSLDDDVGVFCGPMVMYLAVHPPPSPPDRTSPEKRGTAKLGPEMG